MSAWAVRLRFVLIWLRGTFRLPPHATLRSVCRKLPSIHLRVSFRGPYVTRLCARNVRSPRGNLRLRRLLGMFFPLGFHGGLLLMDWDVVFRNAGGRWPAGSSAYVFPNFDHGVGGCTNSYFAVSDIRPPCLLSLP